MAILEPTAPPIPAPAPPARVPAPNIEQGPVGDAAPVVSLALQPTELFLALGSAEALRLSVTNRSGAVDQLQLVFENVDPTWIVERSSRLTLFPGDQGTLEFGIALPEDTSIEAGVRHVVLSLVSRNLGRQVARLDLPIEILPVGGIEVEMAPRSLATASKTARFRVAIRNPGNVEQVLDLRIQDPDDALVAKLELDRIALQPGSQQDFELTVRPRERRFLDPTRRHSFTLILTEAGEGSGQPIAQLEAVVTYQRRLPWLTAVLANLRTVLFVLLMLAIAFMVVSWYTGAPGKRGPYVAPTPVPAATPDPVVVAAEAAVAAEAEAQKQAAEIEAKAAEEAAKQAEAAAAEAAVAAEMAAATEAAAAEAAAADAAAAAEATATADAAAADAAAGTEKPPPFGVQAFDVRVSPDGSRLEVTWDVAGAKDVVVSGTPQPAQGSAPLETAAPGGGADLVASGGEGDKANRSVGVLVLRPPEVIEFSLSADEVDAGALVKATWSVARAARVALIIRGVEALSVPSATGTFEIRPGETTTLVLVAENALGRTERRVTIRVRDDPRRNSGPLGG